MEIILNVIVVMGIEERPVLFQITAKVMVQALLNDNACNGKACKYKCFKANACKGVAFKGNESYDKLFRAYASMGKEC
jgi:hypothetical protein